jgi:hypothetical protein
VQKVPEVVEVLDVQFPRRARTTGVICAFVVRSVVRPDTPVARVLTPSLTSYVRPVGAPGVADAVQVTRQVVGPTRDALTLAGAYGDRDRLDTAREPGDVEVVKAAQTTPPEIPSAHRAPMDSFRVRRRSARRSARRPPSAIRVAARGAGRARVADHTLSCRQSGPSTRAAERWRFARPGPSRFGSGRRPGR